LGINLSPTRTNQHSTPLTKQVRQVATTKAEQRPLNNRPEQPNKLYNQPDHWRRLTQMGTAHEFLIKSLPSPFILARSLIRTIPLTTVEPHPLFPESLLQQLVSYLALVPRPTSKPSAQIQKDQQYPHKLTSLFVSALTEQAPHSPKIIVSTHKN
jgi:hypothetical protein